jgi:hypothetical protein
MDGDILLANREKGQPVARPGRKAMGLLTKASIRCREIARLPQDWFSSLESGALRVPPG